MANTFENINESSERESWVMHTSGAEMPDTSKISTMKRRLQAAMPVVSNELNLKTVLIPLIAVGLGASIYYFVRQFQNRQVNLPNAD